MKYLVNKEEYLRDGKPTAGTMQEEFEGLSAFTKTIDRVSHPTYYNTGCPVIYVKCKCGETLEVPIECIDVIRNMPTWKGSTIKYLWRAGLKEEADMTFREKEIEDLRKAIFYIEDRIKMLENDTEREGYSKAVQPRGI